MMTRTIRTLPTNTSEEPLLSTFNGEADHLSEFLRENDHHVISSKVETPVRRPLRRTPGDEPRCGGGRANPNSERHPEPVVAFGPHDVGAQERNPDKSRPGRMSGHAHFR